MIKIVKILFTVMFISGLPAQAVLVSGTITDDKMQRVPFCSVYLKGTSIGTTANVDGQYSLEVGEGTHEIIFRSIGYKLLSRELNAGTEAITLDIMLIPESYLLKEALINASAEDPAYAIIRKAQSKRKQYLDEVQAYQCEAYEKQMWKMPSKPEKIMGVKIDLEDDYDSLSHIIYLSESVSKISIQKPGKRKEEIISSRVRGNPRGYSFNQASYLKLNFYENLMPLGPRGLVSPISATAMLYYDYKLEGTFMENGETVNKIRVIPKRNHDPVYTGDIYILDDSWRIHSLDLFITGEQQLPFIDTVRMVQTYVPVEKKTWMLMNSEVIFSGKFLGFSLSGIALGVFSNYNLHPDFSPRFFDNEILKINKESNRKDTTYWNTIRPVPITLEEYLDYRKHDSLYSAHKTKAYKDSIDRKKNKFRPGGFILGGYTRRNSWRNSETSFSGLADNLQFNTVEGWVIALNAVYEKRESDEGRRKKNVVLKSRYGFSNRHFNGNITFQHLYDPFHYGTYSVSAGTDVSDFNGNAGFSKLVNSGYSLIAKKNWLKLYEKRFVAVAQRRELFNGAMLRVRAEYADRNPLVNTTSYSWSDDPGRDYLSNDPLNKKTNSIHFQRHQSVVLDAMLRIRIKQRYIMHPEGKNIMGSRWPEIRLNYKKAFPSFAGAEMDFDFASISMADRFQLGLFGRMEYLVTYGKFLNSDKMEFMDYHHFNGNQTLFADFTLYDFELLPYYHSSTKDDYIEAHAEYSMGGLILNKVPLLRKLKLSEIVSAHFFRTPVVSSYLETSFGIAYFRVVRADFVLGFNEKNKAVTGFVFHINLPAAGRALDLID